MTCHVKIGIHTPIYLTLGNFTPPVFKLWMLPAPYFFRSNLSRVLTSELQSPRPEAA